MKINWRKIREFDKKGPFMARVEGELAYTKNGYVFDRRIFKLYLLVVFVCIAYIGMTSDVGVREFYIHCPEDGIGPCNNPCYESSKDECSTINDREFLPRGFSMGNPPDEEFLKKIEGLWWVIGSGLLVAFCWNKFKHNMGKKLFDDWEDEV